MIKQHYGSQPGVAASPDGYHPCYYWLEPFAVGQHQQAGSEPGSPGGPGFDLMGVLRACQGCLVALTPWRSPAATRWLPCLVEVVHAMSQDLPLQLLLGAYWQEVAAIKGDEGIEPMEVRKSLLDAMEQPDVDTAEGSLGEDREKLLLLVQGLAGGEGANQLVRRGLRAAALDALLLTALRQGAVEHGRLLLAKGAGFSGGQLVLRREQLASPPASIQLLSHALEAGNARLRTLCLAGVGLGDAEAALLCTGLAQDTACTRLDLRDNAIGNEGACRLAELLCNGKCKVEELLLGGNTFDDAACAALSGALQSFSCKLRVLSLAGCKQVFVRTQP